MSRGPIIEVRPAVKNAAPGLYEPRPGSGNPMPFERAGRNAEKLSGLDLSEKSLIIHALTYRRKRRAMSAPAGQSVGKSGGGISG